MSDTYLIRSIKTVAFGCVLVGLSAHVARAQTPPANIRILTEAPARVRVEGECRPGTVWSFPKSYAGVMDLGNRIKDLMLDDASGQPVSVRRVAPGEFEAATRASRFRYEVDLSPPARVADAAFVSWLSTDRGLLMPGDLLPACFGDAKSSAPIRVTFAMPPNWIIESTETRNAAGEFELRDSERAVFVAGKNLRTKNVHIVATRVSTVDLKLAAAGVWAFTDNEALDLARQVIQSHAEVFGETPRGPIALVLMPFPADVTAEKWSAETRGSTVTVLMGRQPSKTGALVQLSAALTHELFHLWVPNGLALDGDYAWFYEGFTLYQAARAAVRLQMLTFDEFLAAIARAYDVYLSAPGRDQMSLLEASQRRWTGGESFVYQKATLVALLYDLALRSQSHGKRSLGDAYHELFRQYHVSEKSTPQVDGNQAAIAALSAASGMSAFTQKYVQRATSIDLAAELMRFGLRVERIGLRSHISVIDPLSKAQRDLLRELGYNAEPRRDRRTRGN